MSMNMQASRAALDDKMNEIVTKEGFKRHDTHYYEELRGDCYIRVSLNFFEYDTGN